MKRRLAKVFAALQPGRHQCFALTWFYEQCYEHGVSLSRVSLWRYVHGDRTPPAEVLGVLAVLEADAEIAKEDNRTAEIADLQSRLEELT